MAPQKSPGSRF